MAGFAAYNLEIIRSLVETADSLGAPVIIQTTPCNIENIGVEYLIATVKVAAERVRITVALHINR